MKKIFFLFLSFSFAGELLAQEIPIISAYCKGSEKVQFLYYQTIPAAHSGYPNDTKNLVTTVGKTKGKPYWDTRYVNQLHKITDGTSIGVLPNHAEFTGLDTRTGDQNIAYGTSASTMSSGGSVAQVKCIDDVLTGGTMVNLEDAPSQRLEYSGPQSTFAYKLASVPITSPWEANGTGNLMIQSRFDTPLYKNFGGNIGGGVNFGFFIKNKKTGIYLNYVVAVYTIGARGAAARMNEISTLMFDTTTKVVHVGSAIQEGTKYTTKSPYSKTTTLVKDGEIKATLDDGKWENFFRVNVSYENLMNVLKKGQSEGKNFGLNPEDWELVSIMIQYELEEEGGKGSLSGSFQSFQVFATKNPI